MKKFLLTLGAMALFAAPSFAQDELADNQQEVDTYYLDQTQDGKELYPAIECVVSRGEGNNYTVNNAFNSGVDMTFNFDLAELDGNGWAPVHYVASDTFVENAEYNEDGSLRLRDYILIKPNNEHWTITDTAGATVEMTRVCFRDGSAWLCPMHVEGEDPWFYVETYVWAETTSGWSDVHYMTFYFDETPQAGGASVGRIEIDNSPVEYYNLQGVKVDNPTNGLYIVRQGKKAHKVMIKK